MLRAYRIVRKLYAGSAFDGEGARRYGGRWNTKGVRMVYCSDSASLAALETFMHMGVDPHTIPHVIIAVDIPEECIEAAGDLPDGWRENPAPEACQDFGSAWARSGSSAVLKIPSAVMDIEANYLINPDHPDFGKLMILEAREFVFDARMWKS